MTDVLRWGILGTGNIAKQFAAGVATSRRSRIVAVGSRSRDSAGAFSAAHGIPTALGSYDELLRCPEVDTIYLSLPNSMHHEWTLKALAQGKHVLCEKPFAVNVAQSREMFRFAERHGRVLIEAFMYRTHPLTHAVIDAVRSGAIGEVRLIRTSFCYRTNRIAGNIRFDRALAGGALMDIGCYCIDFSRLVAGTEPLHVHATARLHPSGVDEMTVGTMTFPDGVLASFTCGMGVQADNTAYICGTEGYIEVPVPWKPTKEKSSYTIARGTPPKMDKPDASAPGASPRETRTVPVEGELYGIEADAFAATVFDGAEPFVTPEDTLGNMWVLEEMRRQVKVA